MRRQITQELYVENKAEKGPLSHHTLRQRPKITRGHCRSNNR